MAEKRDRLGDILREKLDKLAEQTVDNVLADDKATHREQAEVLKTVGQYYLQSRRGDGSDPKTAGWANYRDRIIGGAANGQAH